MAREVLYGHTSMTIASERCRLPMGVLDDDVPLAQVGPF